MDDVLSPRPLDPERAMMETIAALEEQVRTRVQSVDNGRKWLEKGEESAPMPDGAEIFETTGAWEDFSTPSRDLRLLIAIDVVRGFPARVARRPERYAMPRGRNCASVGGRARERSSTASSRHGSIDVHPHRRLARSRSRWPRCVARSGALRDDLQPERLRGDTLGRAASGAESLDVPRAAPAEQKARMETYRAWFHERRRPPRK